MTTPHQPGPDGAWGYGSRFGQGMDADSVTTAMTSAPRAKLNAAVGGISLFRQQAFDTSVKHTDGQNSIRDRLEYLANTSGLASAYMHRNWIVPRAKWVYVPFPGVLGPQKHAAVDTVNGRLILKAGGLWQIWVTLNDYSYNWYYTPPTYIPGNPIPIVPGYNTYYACSVRYQIEVLSASGQLLAAERFHAQTAGSVSSGYVNNLKSGSASFECSVVLEDMPSEDAPGASNHWAYVRVAMYVDAARSGLLSGFSSRIYGGTSKSALIAVRWSRDVANTAHALEVGDGGTLTS